MPSQEKAETKLEPVLACSEASSIFPTVLLFPQSPVYVTDFISTCNSQWQVSEIIKLIFLKDESDLDVGELGGREKGKDLAVKRKVSEYILFCP